MEAGIYGSHIVWRVRYREVIREAKASGKTVDEILEPGNESDVEKGDLSEQPGEEPKGVIDTNGGEQGNEASESIDRS